MPLPRFDNLDPAQRARILGAARAEFAQHGYEQASLARIAAEAGVSKGTLYYYFADRDDVYASVVLDLLQSFGAHFSSASFKPTRAADYWPALERLFHGGVELAREHPDEMRALRSFQVSLRRHPRPAFEPVIALITSRLRLLVDVGARLGCVRTDVDVSLLVSLLQAADEVLDQAVFADAVGADDDRLHAYADLAVDTFRRLVEPREKESRSAAANKSKRKTR